MMKMVEVKVEERRNNSVQIYAAYAAASYLQPSGQLFLQLSSGRIIHTSPVKFVFQETDDSLVFQTRSGTEYVVTFQDHDSYCSDFARSISHVVMETNVTTLICRPHMCNIFNRLAR